MGGIHEDLTYVFLLHSITEHVVDMCNFAITYVTSWQKFAPTHCGTVQEWITEKAACQRTYPPHYFDIVWASPICTEYSKAKSTGLRIEGGLDERHHH